MSAGDIAIALAVGLVAGSAAGLFGVGGGFVMVPAMVLLLDEPQHLAQGTSLLVIVPTTLVGTASNLRRGNVDRSLLVVLGIAGAVGAAVGAMASVQLTPQVLRRMFGVLLIVVSVRMLVRRTVHEPGS